jgi:hypothetical protein
LYNSTLLNGIIDGSCIQLLNRTLVVSRAIQIDRLSICMIKEPNRSIYHVDIERVLLLEL